MENVIVTYTEEQLKAFKIAELKTLDLFKRSKTNATKKADIIADMLKTQKAEVAERKAKAKAEKEAKGNVSNDESNDKSNDENNSDEEEENEKATDEKPKKTIFHRVKRRVNPHMH